MSSALFYVVNLSSGEYVTTNQYNRASIGYNNMTPSRFGGNTEPKSWCVSPPSNKELVFLARYLALPIQALDPVVISPGYAYDPE